jgi:hypothetical protein
MFMRVRRRRERTWGCCSSVELNAYPALELDKFLSRLTKLNQIRLVSYCLFLPVLVACKPAEKVEAPSVQLMRPPTGLHHILIAVPESFDNVVVEKMTARHVIENANECVPVDRTKALGGSRPRFTQQRDIRLSRTDTGEFAGTLHANVFKSDDYYSLGKCNWTMQGIEGRMIGPLKFSFFAPARYLLADGVVEMRCKNDSLDGRPTAICASIQQIGEADFPEDFKIVIYFKKDQVGS